MLARKGKRYGLKNHVVSYAANYNPVGRSFLCVYGWTKNPIIEYYILDSWEGSPPGGGNSLGTITSDDGTYNIYRTERVNKPSIEGTKTFYQYWRIRTSRRTEGTITCVNHFNDWTNKGLNMGSLYEVSFCVKALKNSRGTCDVYDLSILPGTGDDSLRFITILKQIK